MATVHALTAGHLTLPEKFFISPLDDPTTRSTVPSLSFLIQHTTPTRTTRIIFDLGIRKNINHYPEPIYKHSTTRQPLSGDPDPVACLAKGKLTPDDIDLVIFSHLHWDHVGTPSDYPRSTYVIGPGAKALISDERMLRNGSHCHFERGLLPDTRTIELPLDTLFPNTMDIFRDGSVYIVSAPGHLDGHINLLVRLESGKYVYLAGDACHDRRLLSGEKDIATWTDPAYESICCIHVDRLAAEKTLAVIRETMSNTTELGDVEVIFAHDADWERGAWRRERFFPGEL
ncbi:hypothetical protein ASPWEDRAFT_747560 [Aspergillus wentii DTO 134E9]|uniref:Metallo-beta-lactamase domain-containing protein n=1 Tax=Aspergillus wentii DTO 134E9 TaxID=1073089 RepID=A0A1L9R9J0_ASPWE|nr:uncharacterized protein ASPWEDRAFT_747560 [Aspergillus wentii DTO 134E9]OJJ31591.1 hypothetical protein ASPWEDRAFT_747560 [Aspergillus wentii DTO 134E9]